MLTARSTDRPIGYWLKRLDRAIDAALVPLLAGEGLTRRHWQTMNVLHEAPRDAWSLTEALRPFWGQGSITFEEVTSDLWRRGWLVHDDHRYGLTAEGEAARTRIAERVNLARSRLVDGIASEEYLATVDVLRRMAANMEAAAAG
jgi:hypothetical protein